MTHWLADRLRRVFEDSPQGALGGGEPPRHRGLVIALCIFASLLLWFTFAMRESYTRILEFPTEVRNLSEDEALSDLPPRTVRAQVEGEGIQLLRLFYDPPVIPLDASVDLVDLGVLAPDVITSVRLESITPQTVRVYKERRIEKRVPVRPRVSITTSPGHHLVGNVVVVPDSITLSGAASILRGLREWPTEVTRVAAADDTLLATAALSDTLLGLITHTEQVVALRGAVREFTEGSRTIDVRVTGVPRGQMVSLEPRTITVTFQVPIDEFDMALATEELWAEVPYSAIRSDTTGSVRPVVRLPETLVFREVRTEPQTLQYYDVLELN